MNKEQALTTLAKGAGFVFVGMVISKLLTYIFRIIIARIGTAEYGNFSLGLAVMGFLSFIPLLGLDQAVLRYVSFNLGKNEYGKIKGTILCSLFISLPLSLILALAVYLLSPIIALNIFKIPELIPLLRIFSISIPFFVIGNIFLAALKAFKKINYWVYTKTIIENLTKVVFAATLIYFGMGAIGAAISYVLALAVTAFLSFIFMEFRTFKIFTSKEKPEYSTNELLSYSWPLLFNLIFVQVIAWTTLLMIGYFKSNSDVGVYNAALPTATLLSVVPEGIMALFIPVMVGIYARKEKVEFRAIFKSATKWIFFINLPIASVLILYSSDFMKVVFSKDYVIGAAPLTILVFFYFSYHLFTSSNHMLRIIKKTKLILFNTAFAAVLNVAFNYYLIPRYGLIGGAIATGTSIFTFMFLSGVESYYLTKIFPFKWNYLKGLGAAFLAVAAAYYTTFNITSSSVRLTAGSIVLALVYAFFVLIFKTLEEEDIHILKTIEKKTSVRLSFVRNIIKKFI